MTSYKVRTEHHDRIHGLLNVTQQGDTVRVFVTKEAAMKTGGTIKFRLRIMVNGSWEHWVNGNKLYHLNKVIDSNVIMPPELNITNYKFFVDKSRPVFPPFSLFRNS